MPFGSTPRVRGDAHEVGAERGEVDGHRAGRGTGVDVHERRPRSRAPAHTAAAGWSVPTSWLASCTVTRAVESVIAADHGGGVVTTQPVDADGHDLERLPFARIEDARVLDRGGDDRGRRPPCGRAAPNTAVFTASVPPRGEHHLARPGPEERRDLLARRLDGDTGDATVGVHPAGIGVMLAQVGEHRLERRGPQRRRRRVVEVDASAHVTSR